jgi:hypothetical protein
MCRYVSGIAQTDGKKGKNGTFLIFSFWSPNRFAPGTDITSITSDSDTATDTLTGTSMAAPRE